jgi:hypothetical protein
LDLIGISNAATETVRRALDLADIASVQNAYSIVNRAGPGQISNSTKPRPDHTVHESASTPACRGRELVSVAAAGLPDVWLVVRSAVCCVVR